MKTIILAATVLLSLSVSAQTSIREIICKTTPNQKTDYFKSDVFLKIHNLEINNEGQASIKKLSFTIVNQEIDDKIFLPDIASGSIEAQDLTNVPYKGRLYKDHVKFLVTSPGHLRAGEFELDYAELIISPEYIVTKKIDQVNNWDKTWRWQTEVRKYSAVLAFSINDHHGDYMKLDCLSQASVNDSKGRQHSN